MRLPINTQWRGTFTDTAQARFALKSNSMCSQIAFGHVAGEPWLERVGSALVARVNRLGRYVPGALQGDFSELRVRNRGQGRLTRGGFGARDDSFLR